MFFLSLCISFLSRNCVKDLSVENGGPETVRLPSHLFSYLQLEKLQLYYCDLDVPSSFKGFRNHVSLVLKGIAFVGNSFRGLIDSCPQLESLRYCLLEWDCVECIYNSAPKLKHLIVSGKFDSVRFKSPQHLMSLSITMDETVSKCRKYKLEEINKILFKSTNLQKLLLKSHACKLLIEGGILGMLPTLYQCLNVLQLSIIESNDLEQLRCVICIIRSCPNVEVLKISFSSSDSTRQDYDYSTCCPLGRLCEVEFASVLGVYVELKLIELLLSCCPALEKFYVQRSEKISVNLESQMTRELMRFRRASSRAEIIYKDPNSENLGYVP